VASGLLYVVLLFVWFWISCMVCLFVMLMVGSSCSFGLLDIYGFF